MTKLPKGSLFSSRAEWQQQNMMGGRAAAGTSGVEVAYVTLYNNAVDGTNLYVCHLEASTSISAQLEFEWFVGPSSGSLLTGSWGPIVAGNPLRPGQLYNFVVGNCIGAKIGGAADAFVAPFSWRHDWPLAVIPPGYSFGVDASMANGTLFVALWWYNGP